MARTRIYREAAEGSRVRMFSVFNTSHKQLLVLATDGRSARDIAQASGHVYCIDFTRKDRLYPNIEEIKVPLGEKLELHWESILLAASKRMEGTVHLDDQQVAVGHVVISQ